nr:diol dehydratase reactivase ATPase-like domain-containing protein [Planosporangium flavigriseum]
MVARTASRARVDVEAVHVAALRPVRTSTVRVPAPTVHTGPLRVLRRGATTASGEGFGCGTPWPVLRDAQLGDGPQVIVVPASVGFREAAARINRLVSAGLAVIGVCVESDEAVLIGSRLRQSLPVVDGVPAASAAAARLLAMEVRPPGRALQKVTDAFAMAASLGLGADSSGYLAAVAASLDGASNAVVAYGLPPVAASQDHRPWVDAGDGPVDLTDAQATNGGPYTLDLGTGPVAVGDLAAVDVAAVLRELRRGSPDAELVLATLAGEQDLVDPVACLEKLLDRPARLVTSETSAARAGALTTPGADGALVIDLGGGTVDVIGVTGAATVAGAGDLLTAVVAAALKVPKALAEYAKRGPAMRVEGPDVATTEDGTRIFLDRPAGGDTVGRLCATGPLGLVPLPTVWSPAEWRGVRRRAKAAVLGVAVHRALSALPSSERERPVLLVGGPAADEEILATLAEVLPPGTPIGRGAVAAGRVAAGAVLARDGGASGSLGHRFAVAYGLATS